MKSQKFIEECLEQHNIFRRLHCVRELSISHDLERSAQNWADHLIHQDHLENSPRAINGDVGENLSVRTSTVKKFNITGNEIALQWYDSIKDYDFDAATGNARSFTQLIWGSTSEVGFGIAHTRGKYVVVAHYSPPGNVRGHYENNVFPIATAKVDPVVTMDPSDEVQSSVTVTIDSVDVTEACATVCSKITTEEVIECQSAVDLSLGEWTDDLCSFTTAIKHSRTESMSSDDTFESDLLGEPELCKARRRQLRQFVRATISAINNYRILHGVPILKHNKDLDVLSQNWAQELTRAPTLAHSDHTYNNVKVGENIASRWSNAKVEYSALEVAEHFYDEQAKYSFYEEPSNVAGFGNFTQMMWKSTKEIGVGKAHYSNEKDHKVFIVCTFYPAGNVLGRFVENVLPVPF